MSVKISLSFLKLKIVIIDLRINKIGLGLGENLLIILITRLTWTTNRFFEHFLVQSLHLNL